MDKEEYDLINIFYHHKDRLQNKKGTLGEAWNYQQEKLKKRLQQNENCLKFTYTKFFNSPQSEFVSKFFQD